MLPTDRPDDLTIEDDDALDRFMKQYERDMARKFNKKGSQQSLDARERIPVYTGG